MPARFEQPVLAEEAVRIDVAQTSMAEYEFQDISFSLEVTNPGTGPLTEVSVAAYIFGNANDLLILDAVRGPIPPIGNGDDVLDAGEQWVYEATVPAGYVTFEVSANTSEGATVTATGGWGNEGNVGALKPPVGVVSRRVEESTSTTGGVRWSIAVSNLIDKPLAWSDGYGEHRLLWPNWSAPIPYSPLGPPVDQGDGDSFLAPGESWRWEVEHVVVRADSYLDGVLGIGLPDFALRNRVSSEPSTALIGVRFESDPVVLTSDTGPTAISIEVPEIRAEAELVIGSDGLPIIASGTPSSSEELFVTHCLDATCRSSTTTKIDSEGSVGINPSIAIGSDGLAIISHHSESPPFGLLVTHCDNLSCTVATSASIADGGWESSIAIGSDGLPIISHSGGGLRVSHCEDLSCSTARSTLLAGSGYVSRIAIGGDDLPIIYHHSPEGSALFNCTSIDCTSFAPPTPINETPLVGLLGIGSDGLPVIAARSTVAHCDDPACTTWTVRTLEGLRARSPVDPKMAIGADGFPVLAHFSPDDDILTMTHCLDVACETATSVDVDYALGSPHSMAIGASGQPVILAGRFVTTISPWPPAPSTATTVPPPGTTTPAPATTTPAMGTAGTLPKAGTSATPAALGLAFFLLIFGAVLTTAARRSDC